MDFINAEQFNTWYLQSSEQERQTILLDKPPVVVSEKRIHHEQCDLCEQWTIVADYQSGDYVCVECGYVKYDYMLDNRVWFEEEADRTNAPMRNRYYHKHHFSERINAFMCCDPRLPLDLLDVVRDEIAAVDPTFERLKCPSTAKDCVRRAIQRLVKRKEPFVRSSMQEKWICIRYLITGLKPDIPSTFDWRMLETFQFFLTAWLRNMPSNRKNILHLNAVMRELIGQTYGEVYMRSIMPYFPLLRNKKKVLAIECHLKTICHSLGWTYLSILDPN